MNPIPQRNAGGDAATAAGHDTTTADAQRFRPMLVRYFRRHLQHEADAEDLAQEALMRLVRSPTQVDHAEAYVVRIAANLLRDRFRRERSHHTPPFLTDQARSCPVSKRAASMPRVG